MNHNNPKRQPIHWTPQMLDILRNYYPVMFNKVMCTWVGVSERTLIRKAKELGLSKVENFTELKKESFSEIVSLGLKKAYSEGRKTSQFKRGVRNNPSGEFRPGHHFDEETEENRKDQIRRTFKKRKLLKIYGLQ